MGAAPAIIFLVGPMGSGKTTVGRRVAHNLGLDFFDCDEEIEKRTGASVNLIFDIEGEAGFRAREAKLLAQLAGQKGALIATGGGSILDPSSRDLMKTCGLVVWLQTSVDQQIRRLEHDKKRPLLQAPDRRARLEALAGERDPLYREVADIVFKSANRHSNVMAAELTSVLRDHLGRSSHGCQHAIH